MNLNRSILCVCLALTLITNFAHSADSTESATPVQKQTDAVLTVENREIFTFRTTVLGIEPQERLKRAEARIDKQLANGGKHHASALAMPPGVLIQIDD